MSASTIALVGALAYEYRDLLPVLKEHMADNGGEVLPHLVMSDVIRWLVEHRADKPGVCRGILTWLEHAYGRGDEDERDVIAVSGVEMLPDPGQPGFELREFLGPRLREIDPWRH